MPRTLHALPAPRAADQALGLLPALAAALDGSGPALLPLPAEAGPARAAREALRPDDPSASLERDDVALVVPTTGSTGTPKGVLLPAAALLAAARATHDRLGGPGQWLLALPLTHVAGLQVLVRSLVAGPAPEVIDLAESFRPEAFVAATARLAPGARRYTALVPTQLDRLLADGGPAVAALASYDAILIGGAGSPAPLLRRARTAGARIVTTYGMSETCGGCVYDGRPLDGVRVTAGADGRLRIGGDLLFAGYRLRPELTARALIDGTFLTEDLGRVGADRRVAVLGRADDVVVTGGENVALPQVEAALAEHPGLSTAAAIAVPDPQWGARVVAVVVPVGAAPTLAALRSWVATRAGRAAAPRQLVVLEQMPLAGPGKVDRRALRDRIDALAGSAPG